MEPGGAAEKWRNHGHGRHFPGNLYAVVTGLLRGPLLIAAIGLDGNCLSPKGKISGTCGSESGDLRVLTVFHDSAGHISRSRRHSGRGIWLGMDGRPTGGSFRRRKAKRGSGPGRTKRRDGGDNGGGAKPGGAYFASGNSPSQTAAVFGDQ